jgi:hypothetical protein
MAAFEMAPVSNLPRWYKPGANHFYSRGNFYMLLPQQVALGLNKYELIRFDPSGLLFHQGIAVFSQAKLCVTNTALRKQVALCTQGFELKRCSMVLYFNHG